MKLAASNLALPPFRHLYLLARLRALGIEGLEVAPDHTWQRPKYGREFPASEVWNYRRVAETAGLRIVGLHAVLGGRPELGFFEDRECRDHTIDHLAHLSAVCRDLGGKTLVLDSRWRGALPVMEAWTQCREFLEMLLPRIQPHGTVLCFGPLPSGEGDFCLTARECNMLSHAIDDPGFGLHLGATALTDNGETGHAHFASARRRLKMFHIDEPGRVRIGTSGAVDHADMRQHLAVMNYRGWTSIVQRFVPDTIAIDELSESVRYVAATYFKEGLRMDQSDSDTARLRVITDTIAAVRPNVQADGGDLELVAVRGDRIEVRLSGKCRSCSMAGQTLGGLRRRLMQALGEPVMVIPEQS